MHRSLKKIKDASLLPLQGRRHRQNSLHESCTQVTLSTQADSAPDDRFANRSLCGIIRGLNPFDAHKCPKRCFRFQQTPAGASCFSMRAVCPEFEQEPHPFSKHHHPNLQLGSGDFFSAKPSPPLEK
jgi:hypothetical protein